MRKLSGGFRSRVITGLVVILPLGLTFWIIGSVFSFFGRQFLPLFEDIPPVSVLPTGVQMLISALLTLLIIWGVGLFARNFIGRAVLSWLEAIVKRTPVASKIYGTIRKVTDMMFVNKKSFKEVALIEYPRRGVHTVVFVTNRMRTDTGERRAAVFVPSTPNPTTGFVIIIPEDEVRVLPVSVNQALEFVFSGGIITPEGFEFPVARALPEGKEI